MRFLRHLVILCTIVSSLSAQSRPNVLFIAVDDLNDWIGCLEGHPQALTPNIDRLAQRGVLFTNAHCAAPACNPSRAAVFSGRLPAVTGVWSNQSASLQKLYPEARLLSTAFSEAGYQTLGTGKLLHSRASSTFDEYFSPHQRWSPLPKAAVRYSDRELATKGTNNPQHVTHDSLGRRVVLPLNRMPSDRKPTLSDGESFDWGPFGVPDADFGDTQITNWAIEQLKSGFRDPFFLAVGYYRPHIPLWAPKRFFERFKNSPGQLPSYRADDLDDVSESAQRWGREPVTAGSHATVLKHQQWRQAVEAYLACVTYIDHEIGRLLDGLEASPFADNTIIVLWSDHGWHLGEKEHWGKWTGWERSTRVPLIISMPTSASDHDTTRGSCERPVSLIDLYPTLVELCTLKGPPQLDGQSLVPLLNQPTMATRRTVATYFDLGNVSLRTDHWRYIRYADGSEELYNLKSDPHEWTNLISNSAYSSRIKTMRDQLKVHPPTNTR